MTPATRALVTLDDVRRVRPLVARDTLRTPLIAANALSARLGIDIRLKLENLQITGSFKARGAAVKLAGLSAEAARTGVIAMSAGNHAQGVAYHAGRRGIPATIVMPRATPFSKVERTRQFGATVLLEGDTVAEARAVAERLRRERNLTFVHPYDDPDIVAGQGTIGLEMLEDAPDLDVIVVPIGGGGLIAGIAAAATALKPEIEIVGAETRLYASMADALAGRPPDGGTGVTVAEGIAVREPGALPLEMARRLVRHIVLLDEPPIERAVQLLVEEQKIVAEGAGAAGLAALLVEPERFRGRRVGIVIGGGNIDSRLLASILMRGLLRDGRMVRLRVEITDMPGTLSTVAGLIAAAGGNIVEVYHHRMFHDVSVKLTELDVEVETRNVDHVREIVERLTGAGFPARRLGMASHTGDPPPGDPT